LQNFGGGWLGLRHALRLRRHWLLRLRLGRWLWLCFQSRQDLLQALRGLGQGGYSSQQLAMLAGLLTALLLQFR
jgi:hypothetical protein